MSDRPLLGICYGMQFVNAMAGGTIYGDAQSQAGVDAHTKERGASSHELRIRADTHLRTISWAATASWPTVTIFKRSSMSAPACARLRIRPMA